MYFDDGRHEEPREVQPPLFELGRTTATPGALAALGHDGVIVALTRHVSGHWGEIGEEDTQANVRAILYGERILSAYWMTDRSTSGGEVRIYVITEADRSSTTVLLCDEY